MFFLLFFGGAITDIARAKASPLSSAPLLRAASMNRSRCGRVSGGVLGLGFLVMEAFL